MSGVTVEVTIAYNVPLDAAATIDAGKGRNNDDRILFELPGLSANQARDIGSAVPFLILYKDAKLQYWMQTGKGAYPYLSPEKIVDFARRNFDELKAAWEWCNANLRPTRKPLRSLGELVFYRFITARINVARSDAFLLKVFAGLNCAPNTPEFVLRNWLLNMSQKNSEKYAMPTIRFTVARVWNRQALKVSTMRTLLHRVGEHKAERFNN